MVRLLAVVGFLLAGCSAPGRGLCGDPVATPHDLGRQLVALNDVSPFDAAEQYRLIYAPSFEHVSVVRVAPQGAIFKGAAAFRRVCPEDAQVIPVEPAAWRELTRLIDASGFWTGERFEDGRHVMDGESWTLEGVRDGEVHAIRVHASTLRGLFLPPRFSALAGAFERMMAMSHAPPLWFARD